MVRFRRDDEYFEQERLGIEQSNQEAEDRPWWGGAERLKHPDGYGLALSACSELWLRVSA